MMPPDLGACIVSPLDLQNLVDDLLARSQVIYRFKVCSITLPVLILNIPLISVTQTLLGSHVGRLLTCLLWLPELVRSLILAGVFWLNALMGLLMLAGLFWLPDLVGLPMLVGLFWLLDLKGIADDLVPSIVLELDAGWLANGKYFLILLASLLLVAVEAVVAVTLLMTPLPPKLLK